MRDGKQLLLDSRQYASEHRPTSWWCLLSTLAVFVLLEAVVVFAGPMPVRIIASIAAGLVFIRLFILYHDYEHGTILRKSRFTWAVMSLYGLFTLNPPSIWRRSHDHHHRHNAKLFGASIGSFPIMTVAAYQAATPRQRLAYRMTRHPLTFLFGYITVFLYGMCIRSLLANPRAHADSAVAIVMHIVLIVGLAFAGIDLLLLCLIVPSVVSAMIGAYLFYAQHNFPAARFRAAGEWDYVSAALGSSSYCRMSPVMAWFTGNIGYHHVHHLNHHIPFYRLPEVMAAMPELQSPGVTSLRPRDIIACLRLKLWDTERQCLVPFPRSPKPRAAARGAYAGDDRVQLRTTEPASLDN